MNSTPKLEQSVRAGIFATVEEADRAVERLLASGFTEAQITVICSDETKESHFLRFEHQDQAGAHTSSAVAAGVSIGAAVGGLTGMAVGAASGTVPLAIAGAAGLSAGSALGGFVGAMLTRGTEK